MLKMLVVRRGGGEEVVLGKGIVGWEKVCLDGVGLEIA